MEKEVRALHRDRLPISRWLQRLLAAGWWRRPARRPSRWSRASTTGSSTRASTSRRCSRPARAIRPRSSQEWTYEKFLGYSPEAAGAAGHEIGNPIGQTNDSQVWLGPLFLAFGCAADQRRRQRHNQSRRDPRRDRVPAAAGPEHAPRTSMPGTTPATIAGSSRAAARAIQSPPSAWAVAVRDAPRRSGSQLWHHDVPAGPKGRYRGSVPWFWGIWQFAQNKSAAKDLAPVSARQGAVRQADPRGARLRRAAAVELTTTTRCGRPKGRRSARSTTTPVRGNEKLIVVGLSGGAVRGRPDL